MESLEQEKKNFPNFPHRYPRREEAVVDGKKVAIFNSLDNAGAWLKTIRVQETEPPSVVFHFAAPMRHVHESSPESLIKAGIKSADRLAGLHNVKRIDNPVVLMTDREKKALRGDEFDVVCYDASSPGIEKVLEGMDPGLLRDGAPEKLTARVMHTIVEEIKQFQEKVSENKKQENNKKLPSEEVTTKSKFVQFKSKVSNTKPEEKLDLGFVNNSSQSSPDEKKVPPGKVIRFD